MNIESLFEFATSLPAVTHDTPFGPDVLCFRIGGKIFGIIGLEREPLAITLKCDPERVPELRATFEGVLPGYHVNKVHWNTVVMGSDVPGSLLRELVTHSYELIRTSLSRKIRDGLPEWP